jgi:hypothetical protein
MSFNATNWGNPVPLVGSLNDVTNPQEGLIVLVKRSGPGAPAQSYIFTEDGWNAI